MATYAVGDIQGCYRELRALLDRCGFSPRTDRLWLAGDLVNRGPDSLAVLRFARDLGDRGRVILGNHDLHLLATARGDRRIKRKDTFTDVLDAGDCDELLDWLRQQSLVHRDPELGVTMVHAGIPPQWDCAEAAERGAEVERALRGRHPRRFLTAMYGDLPDRWSTDLHGQDRLRFITNALTRMRYCDPQGRIDVAHSGPPGSQPQPLVPWFEVPGRRSRGERVIFGHWATLLLEHPPAPEHGVEALDTGCVWGGTLSALCLEDGRRFSVPGPR